MKGGIIKKSGIIVAAVSIMSRIGNTAFTFLKAILIMIGVFITVFFAVYTPSINKKVEMVPDP